MDFFVDLFEELQDRKYINLASLSHECWDDIDEHLTNATSIGAKKTSDTSNLIDSISYNEVRTA